MLYGVVHVHRRPLPTGRPSTSFSIFTSLLSNHALAAWPIFLGGVWGVVVGFFFFLGVFFLFCFFRGGGVSCWVFCLPLMGPLLVPPKPFSSDPLGSALHLGGFARLPFSPSTSFWCRSITRLSCRRILLSFFTRQELCCGFTASNYPS